MARARALLLIGAAVAAVALHAGPGAPAAHAAALTEVTGFGTNPGNLRMFEYVPTGLPAGAPLVVLLHGCTQSAASIDAESGWAQIADANGIALALPQQQTANESSLCFNAYSPGDQARGAGEPLSIKQMVDWMAANRGIDASRVYVPAFPQAAG